MFSPPWARTCSRSSASTFPRRRRKQRCSTAHQPRSRRSLSRSCVTRFASFNRLGEAYRLSHLRIKQRREVRCHDELRVYGTRTELVGSSVSPRFNGVCPWLGFGGLGCSMHHLLVEQPGCGFEFLAVVHRRTRDRRARNGGDRNQNAQAAANGVRGNGAP